MHGSLWRSVAIVAWSLAEPAFAATTNGDVFSSTGSPPGATQCGTAYKACQADNHLKTSTNARYRKAGESCSGSLNSALAEEAQLNAALPQLETLTGKARTALYDGSVSPKIAARGEAMDEFRSCMVQAMEDLRPDDFPKAPLLLAGSVSNDADALGQLADDVDRMVAESADNAMLAGDRFTQGILDWANETATFLAQEPGTPLEQIVQGTGTFVAQTVPAYLMNNNADNHRQLYEAAAKAVDDFKKDPFYHIGHAAPNAIPVGALSRAKTLAALRQTTNTMKQLTRRKSLPGGLEPGVRNEITKRPPRQPPQGGDYDAGPPPGTDGFPLDRPPSVDHPMDRFPRNPYPECGTNCFTVQVAKDLREYYKQPFQAASGNLGTLENQWALLREVYGGPKARDPYHGPRGLQKMAEGVPVPSSPKRIQRALERAAKNEKFTDMNGNPTEPAPRGMAYVEYTNGEGHAFDAKWNPKLKDTVFTDDTQDLITGMDLFKDVKAVWFYRQR